MRIVHTCLRYPPASGGAERYIHELVERTRALTKTDVRVLTSKMRTHHPITELNPKLLLDDPPYVQRLHHAATWGIAYPRLQALGYYLNHHQPDVIHGHGFWYQPADVAARYAHKNNIPFILHPLYYENAVRQKQLWQLYKSTIGRHTFAAADAVVVISPYEQQLIEKAGFPVKRFVLLPPGIVMQDFSIRYDNPFHKRSLASPILLAVGRVSAGKGLDDIIASLPAILKEMPTANLVIIGEDFGAKKHLREQAKRLGIGNAVHFWGNSSDEELRAAYQHADIFIHASHYEAFGIVLAESLAAKIPIVARNAAAIPYVVPHEKAGLLFNNRDELASQVIDLLKNSTKRESLATFGYQHVKNNFTWDRSIKKLVELYGELGQ